MASIHVIIQSGKHGLGIAADYYKTVPWEPSPAGDIDLKDATFKKIEDITFADVLEEMAKGPAGGLVLIICHAHDEFESLSQSSGLLMPLFKGARMSAQDDAFKFLIKSMQVLRRAKTIAAMQSTTEQEKKAKDDEWIKLATDFNLGFPQGNDSPQKHFEKGLDDAAAQALGPGRSARFRQLIASIEKVQALKLGRVEFRACKIGRDEGTLKNLKTLFGCQKLLAPAVRTFYIDRMPIDNLTKFDKLYISDHRVGQFRPPGPIGRDYQKDPAEYFMNVIKTNPSSRLFWDVEYGNIPPPNPQPSSGRYVGGTSTIKSKGRVLAMLVERIRPAWYRASAATWHEDTPGKPQWDDARKFVQQYIWKPSSYKSGTLMISGFWTPDEEVPWLLPSEPDYIDHIAQV